MAAICGSERSTGRLIDVAPRSSRTRCGRGIRRRERHRYLQHEITRQVAGLLHPAEHHQLPDVGDQRGTNAQLRGMPDVLDSEGQLIGATQRGTEHLARHGRGLHADVPVGARSDEEAHFYPLRLSQGDHPLNLLVGLEHDAAALADAMNRYGVLAGGRHDRLHRAWPFARRDLDAVLSAVVETLARGRQVVCVAGGQR